MFSSYFQVRDWLETFIPLVYGKEELGLARIEYLLKLLGNPERKFKSIHVAGTSGKGSTAYYISRLLYAVNYKLQITNYKKNLKIGLHISPHLVDIRERMQIFENLESRILNLESSSLMPMGKFLKLFNEIRPVIEKIQKDKPELTPSYFEILVAATFKYFAEEKVDWAVVEVGLGGRLDATNVLMPEVSVITNIGLDHTEILGDTVEKIAWEKAGIIKEKVTPSFAKASDGKKVSRDKGVPVVTGATGSALRVIEKVAREKGAEVNRVKSQESRESNFAMAKKAVEVALSLRAKRSNLRSAILGSPSTSLRVNSATPESRKKDSGQARMTDRGLDFNFPGRFEEIDEGVILDGAHNPDKIKALINFVNSKFQSTNYKKENEKQENNLRESVSESRSRNSSPQGRTVRNVVLVLAFKKGKDWQKMVDLLIENLPVVQVIATEFNAVTDTGMFGAVSGKEIKDYLDTKFKIPDTRYYLNSQEAVFAALQSTINNQQSTIVLVTGSLYLVGEVRTMWELPEF